MKGPWTERMLREAGPTLEPGLEGFIIERLEMREGWVEIAGSRDSVYVLGRGRDRDRSFAP